CLHTAHPSSAGQSSILMMKNCIPSAIYWHGARHARHYSLLPGEGRLTRWLVKAIAQRPTALPAVNAGEAGAIVTPASNGREWGAWDVPRTIWQRTVPDMGI